jgi:hypothetical protein
MVDSWCKTPVGGGFMAANRRFRKNFAAKISPARPIANQASKPNIIA